MSEKMPLDLIAKMDQEWAEASEWISHQELTQGFAERMYWLFVCDASDLRGRTTDKELNVLRRLARLAFNELLSREIERATDGGGM